MVVVVVVHVLLEFEAELIVVLIRITGFLELVDMCHTLVGLFT